MTNPHVLGGNRLSIATLHSLSLLLVLACSADPSSSNASDSGVAGTLGGVASTAGGALSSTAGRIGATAGGGIGSGGGSGGVAMSGAGSGAGPGNSTGGASKAAGGSGGLRAAAGTSGFGARAGMGGSDTSKGGANAQGGRSDNGPSVGGGSVTLGGNAGKGGAAGIGSAAAGGAASGGAGKGGTSAGAIGGTSAGAIGGTSAGATGGSSAATPDCNGISGQPVINVVADGTGQYRTIRAALDTLTTNNQTLTQIRIAPGTYREKLVVDRPKVTLCGQAGKATTTVITFADNANTSNGSGGTLGTSGSASVHVSASDVSVENLTIANGTGAGVQAVALMITGSRVQFRNSRFTGYQDTLYVRSGTQYFRNCYVEGSVDFIFGAATAVFDGCTMHSVAGGAVTAPSTEQTTAYGIVFLGGELTAASGVAANACTLGRNWRPYGATAYLKTTMGAHIAPVGWQAMGSNTLDTARFSEYQTTGPGATASRLAQRAPQSKQLTASEAAAYVVPNFFGTWTPSFTR